MFVRYVSTAQKRVGLGCHPGDLALFAKRDPNTGELLYFPTRLNVPQHYCNPNRKANIRNDSLVGTPVTQQAPLLPWARLLIWPMVKVVSMELPTAP